MVKPFDLGKESLDDIQELIFLEKQTEEILKYPTEEGIIDEIDKMILGQESAIQVQAENSIETTFLSIYKLEINRIKYMLKSYLRRRLQKVSYVEMLACSQSCVCKTSPFISLILTFRLRSTICTSSTMRWASTCLKLSMSS